MPASPPRATPFTRALVTGARGFIGRHLVRRLHAAGIDVHATTRAGPAAPPPGDRPADADAAGPSPAVPDVGADGVRWWSLDLADAAATVEVVAAVAPDVVFHLASDVRGSRDAGIVLDMLEGNLRSAVAVMSAAARVDGCRVVLAGSVEEPHAEGDDVVSPYAAAKSAATTYAALFDDLYGVSVTVLRLAMVYGPDQPDESKVVPYTVTSLLAGRAPQLGSGRRPIDWVHVDDVVDAFMAAGGGRDLAGGDLAGAVLDVGSGTGVPLRTVVGLVTDAVRSGPDDRDGPGDGPVTVPEPSWDEGRDRDVERVHLADPAPIRERLGWEPRVELAAGLAGVVDFYRRRTARGVRAPAG